MRATCIQRQQTPKSISMLLDFGRSTRFLRCVPLRDSVSSFLTLAGQISFCGQTHTLYSSNMFTDCRWHSEYQSHRFASDVAAIIWMINCADSLLGLELEFVDILSQQITARTTFLNHIWKNKSNTIMLNYFINNSMQQILINNSQDGHSHDNINLNNKRDQSHQSSRTKYSRSKAIMVPSDLISHWPAWNRNE